MFGSIKYKDKKVKTIRVSDIDYVKYDCGMYSIFMNHNKFIMLKPEQIIKGFNHLNKIKDEE